jgi:rhodanese-related sulfurtransferase
VPVAAGVLYPVFGLLLSPIIAAAAMVLSSVSVIGNARGAAVGRLVGLASACGGIAMGFNRSIHLAVLGFALSFVVPTMVLVTTGSERAQAQDQQGFTVLHSAELAAMLKNKAFFLVNVHVPYEGEIKDTDVFIPFDRIADNLSKLPASKDAKIVLYCRSGRMSEIAARELAKLGYTGVYHLAGGMNDWKNSGHQILEK